jgi:hypothetical protein
MSKPLVLPRWATISGAVTPTISRMDNGWLGGERPAAQYMNWLGRTTYDWLAYLNAGAFEGASSFDSTLAVAGLVTANAGLTVGANQHVTVSGTGDVKHGAREIVIPGSAFIPVGTNSVTAPSYSGTAWTFGAPPTDTINAPVELRVGDRILSIVWHFNKASSASTLIMTLATRNGTTNVTRDTLADITSGAAFTSVARAINYTLVTGDATKLTCQAGNVAHQFSHAVISYDHP